MELLQLIISCILILAIYIMVYIRFKRPRFNKLIDIAIAPTVVSVVYIGECWGFKPQIYALLFLAVFLHLRNIKLLMEEE